MIGRIALVLVLVAALSEPAYSCDCYVSSLSREVLASYDAIFEGEVLQLRLVETPTGGENPERMHDQSLHVVFRVRKSWKGVEQPVVEVVTHPQSTACGFPFFVGEGYVVFASQAEPSRIGVSLCGHTRTAREEDPAYEVLGPPKSSFETVFATSAFWKD